MPGSVDALRGPNTRTKVKTGCKTCRIRKIKCDEEKPYCKRCVSTGRSCDGYESIFRFAAHPSPSHDAPRFVKAGADLPLVRAGLPEIAPQDIERLNRCFSIKTRLDVKLGCGAEAKQLLEASGTDPVIRHAIASLRALRQDLDEGGDGKTAVTEQAPNYGYGLQQYSMALGGLVSDMSFESPNKLKSALLCCQIFISIEQLLGNYDGMAQHIIRGLMIMHEYRARPTMDSNEVLLPAYREDLPMLDVFIVNLFAAPLLELLDEVAQVPSIEVALQLQPKKVALLQSLGSWLKKLDLAQTETGSSDPEPISAYFQRLFYHILQVVLISTLDASPASRLRLGAEMDKLQSLANAVGQRVRDYRISETRG